MESGLIKRVEGCPFCSFSGNPVGSVDKYDASIVYRTGEDLQVDWFATLQPSTFASPWTAFNLQLMPLGHLEAFCEAYSNPELAKRWGLSLAALSYATQVIREEEWKSRKEEWKKEDGVFKPSQIIYGKCLTPENTQAHLHIKLVEFSGGLAQAFPTDNGWARKELYSDIHSNGPAYVRAIPTKKQQLDQERLKHLTQRFLEIFNG